MGKIAPIMLTILLAGLAGFALGRTTAGLTDRIVASSALKVQGCNQSVTQKLHFSDPSRADLLSADTVGAACDSAVAVLSLRAADGRLLYSLAAPFATIKEALPGADPLRAWLQPQPAKSSAGFCFQDMPPKNACIAWNEATRSVTAFSESTP